MKYWISAIRPKTLTASIGPVILGLSLSYFLNASINYLTAVLTLTCALLLQISSNLINDYYDGIRGTDNNHRLGPARVTSSHLIAPSSVKRAFILTLTLSFILGLYLMLQAGWPIVIIGTCSLFFAYLYTGGPLPLSHYALGEVLAYIFFGPVAVWGTFYIQTNYHSNLAIIAGSGPGFIAAALMGINNLRDQQSDRSAKKYTLAVLLGEQGSRLVPLVGIAFSIVIPVIFLQIMKTPNLVLAVCFTPFFFIKTWQTVLQGPIDESLNISLANTGKYLFVYSLVFTLALLVQY